MTKRTFEPHELIPSIPGLAFWPKTLDELLFVGADNLRQMIRHHRKEERLLRQRIENPRYTATAETVEQLSIVRSKIGRLNRLKANAPENRPVFPVYRPMTHFLLGHPVICFVGDWPSSASRKQIVQDWVSGVIHGGPTFTGTRYAVFTEVAVHIGPYLDGHGCDFSVADPRLLHRWEFEYLIMSPRYNALWMDNTVDYAPVPLTMRANFEDAFDVAGL